MKIHKYIITMMKSGIILEYSKLFFFNKYFSTFDTIQDALQEIEDRKIKNNICDFHLTINNKSDYNLKINLK